MVKTQRRKCDNPECGKVYRYSKATSRYCGRRCRDKVYRDRKVENEKAETAARWAKLREQAQQIDAQIAKSEPGEDSEEPPAPAPVPRPVQPKPKPISRLFPLPKEAPARITIRNVPTRFPGTPLSRRQ